MTDEPRKQAPASYQEPKFNRQEIAEAAVEVLTEYFEPRVDLISIRDYEARDIGLLIFDTALKRLQRSRPQDSSNEFSVFEYRPEPDQPRGLTTVLVRGPVDWIA